MKLETLKALQDTPAKIRPMTPEETESFIIVSISASKQETIRPAKEIVADWDADPGAPFTLRAIAKRLQLAPDLEFSEPLLLTCILLAPNIASVVMWAYTIVKETRAQGRPLTVLDFATKIVPWGVPTDDAYHEMWLKQKIGRDNWLDTYEPWKA